MRIAGAVWLFLSLTLTACGGDESFATGSRFAVAVVDLRLGEGSGFGADSLPDIVLGPPRGGGLAAGSLDTLSLGLGGSIIIELGTAVADRPGDDVIVFENAFAFGGTGIFAEPGTVSFSADGDVFHEVPCDAETEGLPGCAGRSPVYAHAEENTIDPTDPETAGGDAFDLADLPIERARYIRIVDSGLDRGFGTNNAGFDLDAVAVIHGE